MARKNLIQQAVYCFSSPKVEARACVLLNLLPITLLLLLLGLLAEQWSGSVRSGGSM